MTKKEATKRHTILKLHRRANPFVQIETNVVRNENLSLKAKGLLAIMLSYDDGWQFSLSHLIRQSTDGKVAHTTAIKELEKAGHIKIEYPRDQHGYFMNRVVHVYEIPRKNITVNRKSVHGKSPHGKPRSKNINKKEYQMLTHDGSRRLLDGEDSSLLKGSNKHAPFALRWGAKIQSKLKIHGSYKHNSELRHRPVAPTTWATQVEYLLHTMHVDRTLFKSAMSWYLSQGCKLPPPKAPRLFRVRDLVDKWPAIVHAYERETTIPDSGMRYRKGPDGEYGYYDDSMTEA